MRCFVSIVVLLTTLGAQTRAHGQETYRRPFATNGYITAHFDTNGPGGGLADYTCGSRTYDGHTGTDFGLSVGTPVLAAARGTVINVFTGCPDIGYDCSPCGGLCGNQVRLRHPDGSETLYCHMQSSGMRVSVGDTVACGEAIGRSASSGCSTGPHLHFGYHASSGSAADDPFRGACGGPLSLWTTQRPYPETPGADCSCARADVCNGRDDDCDGRTDEGDACEVPLLQREPGAYAPPTFTDVDGDGTADVCARGYTGVRCWPSTGGAWAEPIQATNWGDEGGWDDVTNYATIRMADIDGDRRADLCARANGGIHCARSLGDSFEESALWLDVLSDDSGWTQPDNYTTIRLADIDGDGRADLCARANAGMRCWISEGSSFGAEVAGPAWSDDGGFDEARHYGTIRTGDVDGDGLADLCGRTAEGFECYASVGSGFGARIEGPRWSNEQGWGAMRFWSTIRLADIDGDGRDDVCARSSTDLRCHRSLGDRFEETPIVMDPGYADESGWDDQSNFATVRVGDIDGDGRDDLCLRANLGIRCLRYTSEGAVTVEGPGWGDDSGWDAAHYYSTFRLADFDGDGLDDFCARASGGWLCHPSTGSGHGDAVELGELSNGGGWDSPQYWTTIQSGGKACRAMMEMCNGTDDDCDGEVDENARGEVCNGVDDDCDGEVDEGACGVADGGVVDAGDPGVDGSTRASRPVEMGGCGCRASGRGSVGALFVAVALLHRRRRR